MNKPILDVQRARRNTPAPKGYYRRPDGTLVRVMTQAVLRKAGEEAQRNGGFVHDTPTMRKIRVDHRIMMARLAKADERSAAPR